MKKNYPHVAWLVSAEGDLKEDSSAEQLLIARLGRSMKKKN